MLSLVYLDLGDCFVFHIIWIVGTRKIVSGIYGFSRGCLIERIALSGSILDFVHLNETAFDILVLMLPCVHTCIGVNNIEPLTPDGFF